MSKPIKRSDIYIFRDPQGFDKFTPIAVVLGRTNWEVSYAMYLDHGKIYDRSKMIPAKEFDYYYHPVNDIEYDVLKRLGYMKLYCDYDDDSEGGLIEND